MGKGREEKLWKLSSPDNQNIYKLNRSENLCALATMSLVEWW